MFWESITWSHATYLYYIGLSTDSDRRSLPSGSEAASDSMVVKKESQSTKDDSPLVFVAPPPLSSKMKSKDIFTFYIMSA